MIDVQKETEELRLHMRLSNFQMSTTVMYVRTLRVFLEYCNTHYGGEPLSEHQVQQYLLSRIESGRSWSTINSDYSALQNPCECEEKENTANDIRASEAKRKDGANGDRNNNGLDKKQTFYLYSM